MSKKKDRLNLPYRSCPSCGRKTINVTIEGRFRKNMVINCYSCRQRTTVEQYKIRGIRMDIEEYMNKKLDLSGGACWGRNTLGLIQVDYCYNESNLKIFWINLKLFIFWILKRY